MARLNLYIQDRQLVADARALGIPLSEFFETELRKEVARRRYGDPEHDDFMQLARAGSTGEEGNA